MIRKVLSGKPQKISDGLENALRVFKRPIFSDSIHSIGHTKNPVLYRRLSGLNEAFPDCGYVKKTVRNVKTGKRYQSILAVDGNQVRTLKVSEYPPTYGFICRLDNPSAIYTA